MSEMEPKTGEPAEASDSSSEEKYAFDPDRWLDVSDESTAGLAAKFCEMMAEECPDGGGEDPEGGGEGGEADAAEDAAEGETAADEKTEDAEDAKGEDAAEEEDAKTLSRLTLGSDSSDGSLSAHEAHLLFNPNHDPSNGQFTTGDGGGSSAGGDTSLHKERAARISLRIADTRHGRIDKATKAVIAREVAGYDDGMMTQPANKAAFRAVMKEWQDALNLPKAARAPVLRAIAQKVNDLYEQDAAGRARKAPSREEAVKAVANTDPDAKAEELPAVATPRLTFDPAQAAATAAAAKERVDKAYWSFTRSRRGNPSGVAGDDARLKALAEAMVSLHGRDIPKFISYHAKEAGRELQDAVRTLPKWQQNMVTAYPPEEYQAMGARVYLRRDDPDAEPSAGFAIKPDGELISVFSKAPGAGKEIMAAAVAAGATKLDCFDKPGAKRGLPAFYAGFGFKETGRVPFDPQYAPKDWDYEANDNPDVVFMERPS